MLRNQRAGHFVQFSSIGGRVGGTPGMGAYQTAKFAVEGFSEVLSSEVKPFGVKVTIVEPGAFRTPVWSMERPPVGADYEETVGATNRRSCSPGRHREPGDPPAPRRSSRTSSRSTIPRSGSCSARAQSRPPPRRRSGAPTEAEEWADVSRCADFPPTP